MNAEQLLALYDHAADAPDAVARLRQTILNLAVRGKLVAQDASDEPASELLKRIAVEKARLVRRPLKAIRSSKGLSQTIRLGRSSRQRVGRGRALMSSLIASLTGPSTAAESRSRNSVPLIEDVDKSHSVQLRSAVFLRVFDAPDDIRKPRFADLAHPLVGSFGIPVPVRSSAAVVSEHIAIIRPSNHINVDALALLGKRDRCSSRKRPLQRLSRQKNRSLAGHRSLIPPLLPSPNSTASSRRSMS